MKQIKKEVMMSDIKNFSSYLRNCKYHIVFAPKYRRQVFYGEKNVP